MRSTSIATLVVCLLNVALSLASAQQPTTPPAARTPEVARLGDEGLVAPTLVKQVKPQYTAEAMKAKVQGGVTLECVVRTDGTVGDVRVLKSLDTVYGLDDAAVKAAKQWRFKPGLKNGKAVPVEVPLELTFTLRDKAKARK